jgi:hypothetical protein
VTGPCGEHGLAAVFLYDSGICDCGACAKITGCLDGGHPVGIGGLDVGGRSTAGDRFADGNRSDDVGPAGLDVARSSMAVHCSCVASRSGGDGDVIEGEAVLTEGADCPCVALSLGATTGSDRVATGGDRGGTGEEVTAGGCSRR